MSYPQTQDKTKIWEFLDAMMEANKRGLLIKVAFSDTNHLSPENFHIRFTFDECVSVNAKFRLIDLLKSRYNTYCILAGGDIEAFISRRCAQYHTLLDLIAWQAKK